MRLTAKLAHTARPTIMDEYMKNEIQLEKSWLNKLEGEFEKPYMQQLKHFLQAEKAHEKSTIQYKI